MGQLCRRGLALKVNGVMVCAPDLARPGHIFPTQLSQAPDCSREDPAMPLEPGRGASPGTWQVCLPWELVSGGGGEGSQGFPGHRPSGAIAPAFSLILSIAWRVRSDPCLYRWATSTQRGDLPAVTQLIGPELNY